MLRQNAVHIVTGHCPGQDIAVGVEGHRARGEERPLLVFGKRFVEDFRVPFPRLPEWLLGARMPYLNGHFRLGMLMNEIGDTSPSLGMCVAPDASAPGSNPAISTKRWSSPCTPAQHQVARLP